MNSYAFGATSNSSFACQTFLKKRRLPEISLRENGKRPTLFIRALSDDSLSDDPHFVLGVKPGCSEDDLKMAFRQKVILNSCRNSLAFKFMYQLCLGQVIPSRCLQGGVRCKTDYNPFSSSL